MLGTQWVGSKIDLSPLDPELLIGGRRQMGAREAGDSHCCVGQEGDDGSPDEGGVVLMVPKEVCGQCVGKCEPQRGEVTFPRSQS